MEKRGYKRKRLNFSIKKNMQLRLIGKVLIIVLVSVLVSAAIFYFYSEREIGSSYRQFHVKAKNFLDYLLPAVICSFLLSMILGFIVCLFYPHHIAGPLYRIEREILNIGKGDLSVHITIRKGDEVTELANNINIMVEELREKIKKIKEASQKMDETLRGTEEGGRQTERLKEICRTIKSETDYFNL